MACCGAYECEKCGGLVIVGQAGIDHYGEHVCDPKRLAEERFMDNPCADFPPELS
jgi:hypothetical protein